MPIVSTGPRPPALAVLAAWAVLACASPRAASTVPAGQPARAPDVRYEPSAPQVVQLMLDLAAVGPGDVVYDLGCGDGRIVIEAARRGARAVGVEIDPALVREARANARAAGVEDRVRIVEGDLYETDLREATVVTLFLQREVNLKLRPRLLSQLRPGARVVSHWHDMGDWPPDRVVSITAPARRGDDEERDVYLWTIRERSPGP
ncbi:MAG TPA: methyltransferase domain-containing protein [Anaeromyxobacter sp.]|nr:methyltransferase domain-containing protein [Anaeromyxobacter sp.]